MRHLGTCRAIMAATVLIGIIVSLSACTGPSPVDQAYYTSGDAFSLGGYDRTIFSTSNF